MVPDCHVTAQPQAELNRVIRTYSTQQIIGLDVNETCTFRLRSGAERVLRLVSVREQRDSVIELVRSADVRVEIDAGRGLTQRSTDAGRPPVALQADDLGWGITPKRVQFGLDA
jgi:hypothetical protein